MLLCYLILVVNLLNYYKLKSYIFLKKENIFSNYLEFLKVNILFCDEQYLELNVIC